MIAAPKPDFWHRHGMAVFGAVLTLIVVLVLAAAWLRRPSDTALVLATSGDCARVFKAQACEDLVAEALAIHARTAPRFVERRLCMMTFGDTGCTRVDDQRSGTAAYVPQIAAILVTRPADGKAPTLLPLYLGVPGTNETVETGQRIFYRGMAVGRLYQNRFGGAQLSRVNDTSGRPLTSADVQRLRRG